MFLSFTLSKKDPNTKSLYLYYTSRLVVCVPKLYMSLHTCLIVVVNTSYLFKTFSIRQLKPLYKWKSACWNVKLSVVMNCSVRNVCVCHYFTLISEHENITTWWYLLESTLESQQSADVCANKYESGWERMRWGRRTKVKWELQWWGHENDSQIIEPFTNLFSHFHLQRWCLLFVYIFLSLSWQDI